MDRRKFLYALTASVIAPLPFTRLLYAAGISPLETAETIIAIDFGCYAPKSAIGHRIIEIAAIEIPSPDRRSGSRLILRGQARFSQSISRETFSRFSPFTENAVMVLHNAPGDLALPAHEAWTAGFELNCRGTGNVTASPKFTHTSLPTLTDLCALYGIKMSRETIQMAMAVDDPMELAEFYLGKRLRPDIEGETWKA